jgi:hypothetical protein
MYRGRHAHSCNDRVLHFDASPGSEVLSLAMGAPSALRGLKSRQGMTDTPASGRPDYSREAKVGLVMSPG